jgi:hypothetical protein
MPKNSTSRSKCPICNKAFGDKDIVIKYHFWSAKDEEEADKASGSLRLCPTPF